jgi:hypothetical protein
MSTDMLDDVVSPIACVSMNHQNQLEQMANGTMFTTTRHNNVVTSLHLHVVLGVCCLRKIYTLKGALSGKVHQALYEKIMKPDSSQDSK